MNRLLLVFSGGGGVRRIFQKHSGMSKWQLQLKNVRRAVQQLGEACSLENDERRAVTAVWLEELFAEVTSAEELAGNARQALALYKGGMGSFQDVGSARMASAVHALARELHAAEHAR